MCEGTRESQQQSSSQPSPMAVSAGPWLKGQDRKMNVLIKVAGFALREGSEETLSRIAALHGKTSVEGVQASRTEPPGLGSSIWDEAMRRTEDSVEGLCLYTGLGSPYLELGEVVQKWFGVSC